MYCSQCGKKVSENMLFCPFCGSPIVIPDQETPEPEKPQEEPAAPLPPAPRIHLFDDEEREDQEAEFVPLDVNRLEESLTLGEDAPKPETAAKSSPPPRTSAPRPEGTASQKRKAPSTFVPQRDFNPNDIFLSGEDRWEEEDDEDEEIEEGGFIARHIRGLVALTLFVVALAVVTGWAFSSAGQKSLAQAGLAWSPSAYGDLAYDAYQAGSYAQAGSYYARALERDLSNFEYANYAGIAYYRAQDYRRAEEMARRAISINANRPEGYQILARLYPDPTARTEEISTLIQQGYQRTGDESLKPSANE